MKKYEYKFIQVKRESGLKVKPGATFEKCKEIIIEEANNGWRFSQVVVPYNEGQGIFGALIYEIIFERELS